MDLRDLYGGARQEVGGETEDGRVEVAAWAVGKQDVVSCDRCLSGRLCLNRMGDEMLVEIGEV